MALPFYVDVKLHFNVNFFTFLFSFYSGNTSETKGTAFVVYEDIFEAKNACDNLSGFNVCNRYLVVLYYQSTRVSLAAEYIPKEIQFTSNIGG